MPSRDQDTTDTSQDQLKGDISPGLNLPKINIRKIMSKRGGKLINKGKNETPVLLNPHLPHTEPGSGDTQRSESTLFKGRTIQEVNQYFSERFSLIDPEVLQVVEHIYDSIQEVAHPHQLPHHLNPVKQMPMMMVKRKLEITPLVKKVAVQKNSKVPTDVKTDFQEPKQVQSIIQ